MFLRGFKEKSNQKFINKLLSQASSDQQFGDLQTVGVLLSYEEFDDFEAFRKLFKELALTSPKCRVAAFIQDEKQITNTWNTYFIPKNIGWKGKILSADLESFINQDFDVLIGYYTKNDVDINLIAALSKSKFKIGLKGADQRIFDLLINVDTNQFSVFKKELKKYLKILKFIT
jgi:hypothetical protein